jgi:hypothetical protein
VKRGIYGGAVGYLGFNGDMDVAIAIRTAVLKDGVLHVQAAAGIVADSVPQRMAGDAAQGARGAARGRGPRVNSKAETTMCVSSTTRQGRARRGPGCAAVMRQCGASESSWLP